MVSYYQISPVNLASAGYLVRWLIQLETALERNPRAPSFHGLELILGARPSQRTSEHLTGLLKARATKRGFIKKSFVIRADRAAVVTRAMGKAKAEMT